MKLVTKWLVSAATCLIALGGAARAQSVADALRTLAPSDVIATMRIVGGQVTSQEEWPWQMALYMRARDGRKLFLCGGSLIAPQWVLSAAHCFGAETSRDPDDWLVATRIDKLSLDAIPEDTVTQTVKRIILHERYDPRGQQNDIALLELSKPLVMSPIALQLSPDPTMEANRAATITGWGLTRWLEKKTDGQGHVIGFVDGETKLPVDPKAILSPDLRKAEIPLVDVADCARDYGPKGSAIDSRNLCAGLPQGGRDSCQGDSGGPMTARSASGEWRQIGIVSWGNKCALAGYPGVYTRVSAFGDWIRGVVGSDLTVASQAPSAPAAPPTPPAAPAASSAEIASTAPIPIAPAVQSDAAIDNSAELAIAFDQGDDVTVGQRVAYRLTARAPGYLAIFDATPDGKLTQIYPNAASLRVPLGATQATTRLEAGQPLIIPDYRNAYRGFNVRIAEPRGEGLMVAVLSDRPLSSLDVPDAPKTFETLGAARAAIGRLRDELARNLVVTSDAAAKSTWSVALRKYTIH